MATKETSRENNIIRRAIALYVDGMRSMVLGKTLWKIILIKLFIIFFVFKLFFFPDVYKKVFKTDSQRAEHVSQVLIDTHEATLSRNITNKFIDRR